MHLAEGLLPPAHAASWFGVAAPFVAVSARQLYRLKRSHDVGRRAFFGMAMALCFAMSAFPIPVPVAGATSHMCATPLLALIFGPGMLSLPVAAVLLLQAVFFAHGGITTLGANLVTLGIVGPFVAYAIARLLVALRLPASAAVAIACFSAGLSVYVADAGILALALHGTTSGSDLFIKAVVGFLPTQLPLGLLESVVSVLVIRTLAKRQLPLLPTWLQSRMTPNVPKDLGGHSKQAASSPSAVMTIVTLMVLLTSLGLSRETLATTAITDTRGFPGLDDILFTRLATAAGRPERPLFPWLTGEVELSAFSAGFFLTGLYIGKRWQQLKSLWVTDSDH
jgi:cobalt/nickel transport system permease protein